MDWNNWEKTKSSRIDTQYNWKKQAKNIDDVKTQKMTEQDLFFQLFQHRMESRFWLIFEHFIG